MDSKIAVAIYEWNNEHKHGEVFSSNVGIELPDTSLRTANASWITNEKWNSLTAFQKQRFLPFAPDFLVEIADRPNETKHVHDRMKKWIENGCRLTWLILPTQEIVFIYRADGTVDKVEGFNNKLSGEDVLPGFEFDLSVLL